MEGQGVGARAASPIASTTPAGPAARSPSPPQDLPATANPNENSGVAGMPDKTNRLWLCTYGPDMDNVSLLNRIFGGIHDKTKENITGCRDKSLPAADTVIHVPFRLMFGGKNPSWGGSGAFLDPNPLNLAHVPDGRSIAGSVARIYLVKKTQVIDILNQWNKLEIPDDMFDIDALIKAGSHTLSDLPMYGQLLFLGEVEGYPVVAPTCSAWHAEPLDSFLAQPTPDYLRSIASGLVNSYISLPPKMPPNPSPQQLKAIAAGVGGETLKLSAEIVTAYLYESPGIMHKYTREAIQGIVEGVFKGKQM